MVSGALFWPQALQGAMAPETVTALREELIATFLARHQHRSTTG